MGSFPSSGYADALKAWLASLGPWGGPADAPPDDARLTEDRGLPDTGDGPADVVGPDGPDAGADPAAAPAPAGRRLRSSSDESSLVFLGDVQPDDGPAVRHVNEILRRALEARASDVHLEVHDGEMRVRFRVDGILQDVEGPPPELTSSILARLRVLGGLDLAEHRRPQDGRMRLRSGDTTIDVRVSSVPMHQGESLVLRILDPNRERFALDELGLSDADHRRLLDVIARPHGMILTTGPGGSGKSTTLYAIVDRISTGREKIVTVEDPVEFDVEGICQVPVNRRIELSFSEILRSVVRQDPDVLLVGEIRDDETADIATHAALTGHLVLSTLHTSDAPSALHRLHDLEVPDYIVAHTVEVVMAQRLVRVVCDACAEEVELDETTVELLGPAAEDLTRGKRGEGCEACLDTGYLGRTGVYELMTVSNALTEAFVRRKDVQELRGIARDEGMKTLREDGVAKVRAGLTTPEEVLRVT